MKMFKCLFLAMVTVMVMSNTARATEGREALLNGPESQPAAAPSVPPAVEDAVKKAGEVGKEVAADPSGAVDKVVNKAEQTVGLQPAPAPEAPKDSAPVETPEQKRIKELEDQIKVLQTAQNGGTVVPQGMLVMTVASNPVIRQQTTANTVPVFSSPCKLYVGTDVIAAQQGPQLARFKVLPSIQANWSPALAGKYCRVVLAEGVAPGSPLVFTQPGGGIPVAKNAAGQYMQANGGVYVLGRTPAGNVPVFVPRQSNGLYRVATVSDDGGMPVAEERQMGLVDVGGGLVLRDMVAQGEEAQAEVLGILANTAVSGELYRGSQKDPRIPQFQVRRMHAPRVYAGLNVVR